MAEVKVASNEILTVVTNDLAENGGDKVREMVSNMRVEREIKKRAEAIDKVMGLLDQEEKNMKKLGPDSKQYDVTGKEVVANYTKKQLDERGKVQKRLDKLINAINKALEKDDYQDVYQLQNGKLEDDGTGKAEGGDKPKGDE